MDIKTEIEGLEQTKRKLEQVAEDIHGKEMVDTFKEVTAIVTRSAKINAPVDRGQLRSSITPEVYSRGMQLVGVVGSNKHYAPYMELGTGVFAGKRRHRVPAKYLTVWAKRHNTNAHDVSYAIFKRGGLEPRHYLQKAFRTNEEEIRRKISRKVRFIVEK